MSLDLVRKALEVRLSQMVGGVPTAYENVDFAPTMDAPYQDVTLLPALPDNPVYGGGYVERGVFQITLHYPLHKGAKDALAQAEAVRAWFPRGLALVNGGLTTVVEMTPEIGPGFVPDNMYELPVRVRWYANVGL
jgi:hypothetical protein